MSIPISLIEVPAREQTDEEEDENIYERYCSICHASLDLAFKGPVIHTLNICLENIVEMAALYLVMDDPETKRK